MARDSIFYLTSIVCDLLPPFHRECVRSGDCNTLLRQASRQEVTLSLSHEVIASHAGNHIKEYEVDGH
jgi:hypothetical protein